MLEGGMSAPAFCEALPLRTFAAPTARPVTPRRASHARVRRAFRVSAVAQPPASAQQPAPAPQPDQPKFRKKRLCVLADGTWQDPDQRIPTNVLRMASAIKQEGSGPSQEIIQQVVFYTPGLGTGGGLDKILGGGFGEGIDQAIKDLYSFLALNYDYGDEVFLFGFSRGAYTVRSLVGLIHTVGLVRRENLRMVTEGYNIYRKKGDKKRGEAFRKAYGGRTTPDGSTDTRIQITCLACFDTVGSLGLPFSAPGAFLRRVDNERYRFHDTTLSRNVRNAIHVMSIDETRKTFHPTRMTPNPRWVPENDKVTHQVTERFFPGGHGGVGGGDDIEESLSKYTLDFLVKELDDRGLNLAIDRDLLYIEDANQRSLSHEEAVKLVDVPYVKRENNAFGLVLQSFGKYIRKISSMDDIDRRSVLARYRNQPSWRPAALKTVSKIFPKS